MHALPLLLAAAAAVLLAPAALRALPVSENFRGRPLPFPAGLVIVAAALLALVPLTALAEVGNADLLEPELGQIALYVLGVALLGLVDDLLAGPARGWRGHGGALLRGELSTGVLKAVGTVALAGLALSGRGLSDARWLLGVLVLALATNLLNLLDLRPGRAAKALVLLGAGLLVGTRDLDAPWALGLFLGPALVLGVLDVRERVLLGDTGANLLGALAGLWLVLTLGTAGLAVALVVLVLVTVYGELRSLSAWIEKTPVIRQLDSIGRPSP